MPMPASGRCVLVGLVAVALGAFLAAAHADDLDAGYRQFLTSCGTCHTVERGGGSRQGPNLFGAYGRKAGTLPGFQYSPVLKDGGWVWDETTLDVWITNAQVAHPGTFMNYRQPNAEKRRRVIDYLKSLSNAN